jgi:hypothetical protein
MKPASQDRVPGNTPKYTADVFQEHHGRRFIQQQIAILTRNRLIGASIAERIKVARNATCGVVTQHPSRRVEWAAAIGCLVDTLLNRMKYFYEVHKSAMDVQVRPGFLKVFNELRRRGLSEFKFTRVTVSTTPSGPSTSSPRMKPSARTWRTNCADAVPPCEIESSSFSSWLTLTS